ncbi:MAG: hypothetical protein ABW224_26535, partial [Kibdelosporangium sp.]
MAIAMKVTVSPERIALRPAETADIEVTVQNASQVVEHFAASVVGLPSNDLWTCEPDVVKLRPKEVGTLRMTISVPERGGLVAGPYTLGLVVKSPYSQEVSRCEELPLDVQPAPALAMNVQPEVANGGKTGSFVVNLANEGNMPMAVTLSGSDPENRVGFKISPQEVRLEPGTVAGAQVDVHSDQPWTGQEKRRTATLKAHAGETVVEKPVAFVQRPKIRGGWTKFAAIAAGLAVLGGMTYGGAKLLQDLKPPPQVIATNNTGNEEKIPPQDPGGKNSPSENNPPSQPPQQPTPPVNPPSNGQPPAQPSQPPVVTTAPGQAQQVPTSNLVNFQFDGDGRPLPTDSIVDGTTVWSKAGVVVSTDLQQATFDCRDAGAQALRISRGGFTSTNPVSGAGIYLTSSRRSQVTLCNAVPLRLDFPRALSAANVVYTSLPDVKYTATFFFENGLSQSFEGSARAIGEEASIGFQVPKGGSPIKTIVFGHSRTVPESTKSITMLKTIGFTTV